MNDLLEIRVLKNRYCANIAIEMSMICVGDVILSGRIICYLIDNIDSITNLNNHFLIQSILPQVLATGKYLVRISTYEHR